MPLRVAAIAYTHYESDPRVRREAEALAGRGDQVTVWALRKEGAPAEQVENGVRVVRLAVPRYRGGKTGAYIASYLRFLAEVQVRLAAAHARAPFDLIHVHTMPDFMVFAALIPKLAGAKVVLDMHDLMPDLFSLKFGGRSDSPVVKALRLTQQAATAFADAVIAVHENQYELLLRDGVPARKLGIVMNAADPALFPPRASEPALGPEGRIEVVYHGTILHRYGVDLAVRGFAEARREEPRLFSRLLGGGDFAPEVRRLADSLGLGPEAFFMNGEHRPLEEVAQAIRGAHIGIVPNRDDHEDSVLPTKLLEYLAVGIPSIASRTRCVSRFFDASHVELVEVGDVSGMAQALLRLARDPARRAALVEGGRRWNAEYGWEVNRGFLFRTFDALCWEKVAAEKKARQAAVEGVKTGTKKAPPAPVAGKGKAAGEARKGRPSAAGEPEERQVG